MVVLLLLLQYELWFANGGLISAHRIKHSLAKQQKVNAKLKKRNMVLSADIKDLKSGNKSIEERARNDLGMIKKGETFYQVVKPDDER